MDGGGEKEDDEYPQGDDVTSDSIAHIYEYVGGIAGTSTDSKEDMKDEDNKGNEKADLLSHDKRDGDEVRGKGEGSGWEDEEYKVVEEEKECKSDGEETQV